MIPFVVPVDMAPIEVRDVVWDGDVAWIASAGGLEIVDGEGSRLALANDLPSREVWTVGIYRSERVVGTEAGAFAYRNGWVAVGPARPVAAITAEQIFYRDGQIHPFGDVGTAVVDAVVWAGGLAIATANHTILLDDRDVQLDSPVADLVAVDDELRVAAHTSAVVIDRDGERVLDILATVAGPVWGTVEGALVNDAGRRIGGVPRAVSALAHTDAGWLVGTDEGVWMLSDAGSRSLSRGLGLCGNFVTGVTRWRGRLVVGTFDRGACVEDQGGWRRIEGLPSEMINEVLADGDTLWVGTADGLARLDDRGVQIFGRVADDAIRGTPGLNHSGVNDLALKDGSLWIADVLGPVKIGANGCWQRHRWQVGGHSYQAVTTCSTGEIWVASEDDGLAALGVTRLGRRNGKSHWRQVNVSDGLPEDWVMDVACAGDDAAWIGTYQRGVGLLDADGWHPIAGLEDAWVQALARQGDALWVGTADGLYVVVDGTPIRVSRDDVRTLWVEGDDVWVGTRTGLSRAGRAT